jgi:protein SCO1/2
LKLSLIDASSKKIGSTADRILLYCFHYDPRTGRYGVLVWRTVQIGCALTILALGSFIAHSLWRERRPAVVPLEVKR